MTVPRRPRPAVLAIAMLAAGLLVGRPSPAAIDARLAGRLDHETAAAVEQIVDDARAMNLPADVLIARALEGASRQSPGPRIVAAVRALASDLEAARDAMGSQSSTAELVAGAAALSAGVHADSLARLRQARPRASLVVPLVVLTDLLTRQVPPATASAAVLAATRARVRDRDLMRLRERIGQDIGAGVSPANATILRTRSLVRAFDAPPGPARTAPGRGPGP